MKEGSIKVVAMKSKLFTTVLVLTCVFLAVYWMRERSYESRMKRIDTEVTAIRDQVRMLRLKTRALKTEIEMLSLSAYVEMVNGHTNGIVSKKKNPGIKRRKP